MEEIWARIEAWLRNHAPSTLETLQSGASDAQIGELENYLNVEFPEDVKALYRLCNGQLAYSSGVIDEQEFLSLERIKDEWGCWKELFDDGTFEDEAGQDQGSQPDPGICNVWWHPRWIPLTHDGGGNHDCLDLNPATGGTYGQMITMWHDDAERKLLASGIRAWLQQYAEALEAGQFVFSEEYNRIVRV
jgi:cell wall assembly regulator SMI1